MRKGIVWCLVIVIGTLFFRGGESFAQEDGVTDCTVIGNADPNLYAQAVVKAVEKNARPTLQIFKNEDMSVALSHMKQYCCSQKLLAKEACSGVSRSRPYYPQSPYIFDHLMYVGMKKLDGIQDDCDVLGMSCETREYDVDPVGWRDEISEIAVDTKGYAPGYILSKFEEFWGDKTTYPKKSEKTMLKAYGRMCQDAVTIRYAVNVPDGIVKDRKQSEDNLSILCENAIAERYARESSYVRTLEIEKGTKFIVDNLKSYLNEYFINKRMGDLVGKYGDLDACFNMVSRYVKKTEQCNQ